MLRILVLVIFLQGCSMWPYKSDFTCPIPDGEKCKSLYAINKLTDEGKFCLEEFECGVSNAP